MPALNDPDGQRLSDFFTSPRGRVVRAVFEAVAALALTYRLLGDSAAGWITYAVFLGVLALASLLNFAWASTLQTGALGAYLVVCGFVGLDGSRSPVIGVLGLASLILAALGHRALARRDKDIPAA